MFLDNTSIDNYVNQLNWNNNTQTDEGAVRYLVERIDTFKEIQIETNRCLPESDHALYLKYVISQTIT